MTARVVIPLLTLGICIGCGTTQWTDTQRSATEQLLITDAMDRAVSRLDFRALAGKTAFIDDTPVRSITDSQYLVSCVRQHMLAGGCFVKNTMEEADYVAEVRAGAVGTDRHDLLYGVPSVNIPTLVPMSGFGIPSQIPEIPFVKRTDQRAVAKIAVFAYNRDTGRPVWQSGAMPIESEAKAVWIFGAGPFQRGSIYDGMALAGNKLKIPLINLDKKRDPSELITVADEAYFVEPGEAPETAIAESTEKPPEAAEPIVQASHNEKIETAPVRGTASSGVEEQSMEPKAGQASPGNSEVPAALRKTKQAPLSLPNAKSAAPGKPVPDTPPPIAISLQDRTGKTAGNHKTAGPPATLSYPAGMFEPDH